MSASKTDRLGSEVMAQRYTDKLKLHIKRGGGQFLRDEDGSLHVVLERRRVPINEDRSNVGMVKLMLDACQVGTLSMAARATIQRLQVHADEKAGKMTFRRFSALSKDGMRLYVPLRSGQLLQVTAEQIAEVTNGHNADDFWLEHPRDYPLDYDRGLDPQPALEHFERLVVATQSCAIPEMKWFVAMGEGLFPFIRDGFPARFLLVHQGSTQQGKTTGAQRFTLLHGLGQVAGDYSVASLGNVGDMGLLVLDNKEQANFSQGLIDFCLFLATGAERARSFTDGRLRKYNYRPVGVITSIEGIFKPELQRRCIEVHYQVTGEAPRRSEIEREIEGRNDQMRSGLMAVLQRYLLIRGKHRAPNPIPEFEEHFTALCDLLRAYGEVTGKEEGWAEQIIGKWDEVISRRGEDEEDELEMPLLRDFDILKSTGELTCVDVCFEGKMGRLYVMTCTDLWKELHCLRRYDLPLPKDARGLSRRHRSSHFLAFRFLDGELAPQLAQLKRTSKSRPIGFFFESEARPGDDAVTVRDDAVAEDRHAVIH